MPCTTLGWLLSLGFIKTHIGEGIGVIKRCHEDNKKVSLGMFASSRLGIQIKSTKGKAKIPLCHQLW